MNFVIIFSILLCCINSCFLIKCSKIRCIEEKWWKTGFPCHMRTDITYLEKEVIRNFYIKNRINMGQINSRMNLNNARICYFCNKKSCAFFYSSCFYEERYLKNTLFLSSVLTSTLGVISIFGLPLTSNCFI